MRFNVLFATFTFIFFNAWGQVVINEYSGANYDGSTDNYGEYEDWMELYNTGGTAVDLNGYYLSDKSDNLTKFQINSPINIASNDYIMVYASGRNEVNTNNIHTNFKITQTKGNEWWILTAPDGVTVVDSIFVRPALTNHSRGRLGDGATDWGIFDIPNPNAANNGGYTSYASTPTFSEELGYHPTAINLIISSTDATDNIYYTLDGSHPDDSDILYTGPININTTTVVKAVCYSNDLSIYRSFIEYGTFFINTTHTVPIISISGAQVDNLLNGNGGLEPVGSFEYYRNGILADKARGEFNEHGNDSWAYDQRGFDYITRDQFGYNHAVQDEIFRTKNRGKFKRLIVKAAANDNYAASWGGAHIRDSYVQSLSQIADLRMDERSYEPCILYLNGEYWGVYDIREKVSDLDFTEYYYDQGPGDVQYLKTWGGTWEQYGAPQAANDWDDLVAFILGNDMTDPDNYAYVKSVYNTGSLIDYFILNTYVVAADWLNWNTSWWRGLNPDGDKKKWRYTLWDMDNTFGHGANYTGIPSQDSDADPCNPENLGDPGGQGHVPIWNTLLQNEDFFDDYINRFADLSNSYFSCDFLLNHLDSLIGIIDPEMPQQINTWGGTYAGWQANVQEMRDFIEERCEYINSGIVDCYDVEGPYTIAVIIEGEGEVQLNDIDINNLIVPWAGEYFGGVDVDFEIDNPNFSFFEIISDDNYAYDPSSTNFSIDLLGDITIIFYFNADEIVYLVEPVGSGNINLNGTTLSSYPFSESYPSGENISLTALPNTGWQIDYWSSNNHNFNPNPTDENVSFSVETDDTVTLHLEPIVYNLTILVDPPSAEAELELNNITIDNFPYSTFQNYGTSINLEAISSTRWEFTHWTSNQHIANQANVRHQSFDLFSSDTIVMYYKENVFHNISYDTNPREGGDLSVNNIPLSIFPFEQTYLENSNILLEAIPKEGWRFSYWTSNNNIILPNTRDENAYFLAQSEDNIIANFEEIFEVFVPNAFTPNNGDDKHNTFDISIYTLHDFDYQIKIFNRIGEPLFESTDPNISWDGSHPTTGRQVPKGVYVYLLKVKSLYSGQEIEKKGTITIMR